MSESLSDDTLRYLRTELLERIAHELRGPVGVTLGALDEIEHALGTAQVEQNRLLFAMARRGARRVLRTAERLTRTALLESASLSLSCLPSDVRTIVQQSVQDAELVEGRSSIRVGLAMPAEPCAADVDSGWLSLALSELIAQSIRCARRGVGVSVESSSTGGVRIIVSDDRSVATEMPSARFVATADRRDAALSWPLVCDVAHAHGAELHTEVLRGEAGVIVGSRVTLTFRAAEE